MDKLNCRHGDSGDGYRLRFVHTIIGGESEHVEHGHYSTIELFRSACFDLYGWCSCNELETR